MRAFRFWVLLLSAASIVPLAGCGSSEKAQPVFAGDFLILKPGRSWTYDGTYWAREDTRATAVYSGTFQATRACLEVTYGGRPALRVETLVSDVTGGRTALANDLEGSDYYVLETSGYYLQAHQTPGGSLEVFQPPRLWMPVPLVAGQTWTWVESWFGASATATCTATGMHTEEVPSGSFEAVQLSAVTQGSGAGNVIQYTWVRSVAPGIGIVRDTRTSSQNLATGEQTWADLNLELRSYSDTQAPPAP